MMPNDWKAEIARIVHWKQVAAEHDKNHVLPWHLPRVGASPDRIADAEAATGVRFSPEFKEFLAHADGWPGFYVLTDLFGTQDFQSGRAKAAAQRPELQEFLRGQGVGNTEAVVIGGSDLDLDVFIHFAPDSGLLPGGVLWFAAEEIDRYPTFSAFFSAMVNYNARIAQKMAEKA